MQVNLDSLLGAILESPGDCKTLRKGRRALEVPIEHHSAGFFRGPSWLSVILESWMGAEVSVVESVS